jgi:hypothetical protein
MARTEGIVDDKSPMPQKVADDTTSSVSMLTHKTVAKVSGAGGLGFWTSVQNAHNSPHKTVSRKRLLWIWEEEWVENAMPPTPR